MQAEVLAKVSGSAASLHLMRRLMLHQKRDKVYTRTSLDQTTKLLDLNPEFYTIWNYRRYILLKGLFPDW